MALTSVGRAGAGNSLDDADRPAAAHPVSPIDRASAWAVWAVWLGAVAVAAVFVDRYARRFPFSDDWGLVPRVTGERPMTLGWLWSQSSEHRLFVPKAIHVTLTRLTGDFRTTVWLDLVLLAAAAAAAIVVMRRLRGRTVVSDAVFPLVTLSMVLPAFAWGYHVHSVSTAVLALGVLLLVTRFGLDVPAGWLWVGVALVVPLLGEGGPGLALLPGFLVWLGLAGWRLRATSRRQSISVLVAVGAITAGIGGYFIGWHGGDTDAASAPEALVTAARFTTSTGGERMSSLWPLAGVLVVGGIAATAGLLVVRGVSSRDAGSTETTRSPAAALACYGFALLTLAGAVGFGRGASGWIRGLENHYAALTMPLVCWVYVVWDRFGVGLGRLVGPLLLLGSLGAFVDGAVDARRSGAFRADLEAALADDVCRGIAADQLADDHIDLLFFLDTDEIRAEVADGIELLSDEGIAGFGC